MRNIDVYKRQGLDFAADAMEGMTNAEYLKNDAQSIAASYILLYQEAQAKDAGPVSYTHLDVYKRQTEHRVHRIPQQIKGATSGGAPFDPPEKRNHIYAI